MLNLILALLGLSEIALNSARRIHARLSGIIFILIAVILIGFGLNLVGLKGINLIFSLVFTAATIIFWTRPDNLVIIAGTGAGLGAVLNNIPRGIIYSMRKYFSFLGHILLWGSIITLFLGTLSFRENPMAFVGIIAALLVIKLAAYMWNFGFTMYKHIIYYYAVIMFLAFTVSLVPGHTWIKITGLDIKGMLGASETEVALSEFEKFQSQVIDKENVGKVKEIMERWKKGIKPSKSDLEFIEQVKKEREEATIPNRIAEKVSQIQWPWGKGKEIPVIPAVYNPPIQAPAPEMKVLTVTPRWEIVAEQFATYNQWDARNQGYIYIVKNLELPPGKYRLEFSGSHRHRFITKDGREVWRIIPPEGLRGEYVAYPEKLPVPGPVGARIMKIDGSSPEQAGSCKKFFLDVAGPVSIAVSVNIPQNWTDGPSGNPRDNFIHNEGGDKVVLKRLITS